MAKSTEYTDVTAHEDPSTDPPKSLQARYDQLCTIREPYLRRAWRCAELTIPSLLPREGHTSQRDLPTPYQSIGARGVNNLASKILLAQLPPNQPFFRQIVDRSTAEEITKGDPEKVEALESALEDYEAVVLQEIENRQMRPPCHEAFKHDIVAGNVLMYIPEEGKPKVYHLDKYVVCRDTFGQPLTIITREHISPLTLPKTIREIIAKAVKKQTGQAGDEYKHIDLYTGVIWNGDKWDVWQEVAGIEVPESRGTYLKDQCPWLALRFVAIDGEDYGRGYVEEYLGDLISDDGLMMSVVQAAAACSRVVPMVRPNGMTKMSDVAKAKNGQWVYGHQDDVTMLQVNKQPDLVFVNTVIQRLEERLAQAFLLNSAVQRQAERVTAAEIRYMAAELEESLGGIYSILAQEFQLPLVNILIAQLTKTKKLPKLPKEVVKTTIITGLEALSREHDLSKLTLALNTAKEAFGPEVVVQYCNIPNGLSRIFTALQVDQKGLIKSAEEIQAEQQAAAQAATMQQIAPNAVKGGVDLALQQNEQEGTNVSGSQQQVQQQQPAAGG